MSNPPLRRAAAVIIGLVAIATLRVTSFAPVPVVRGDQAWVRLSWSARPERIEHCRRLSDAELAERPAHMRLRLECEGRLARYVLRLVVDDTVRLVDTVRGGGLRHDRPMHVLRDVTINPGQRHVVATLVRLDSARASEPNDERPGTSAADPGQPKVAGADRPVGESGRGAAETESAARERRESEERSRRFAEAIPPHLSLDTLVRMRRGRVLLISYDGAARQLVALSDGS